MFTTVLSGTLDYHGESSNHWKVSGLDLQAVLFDFFRRMNGQRVTLDDGLRQWRMFRDEGSRHVLHFEQGPDVLGILLKISPGFGFSGFSNARVFLEYSLQAMNGRSINVSVNENELSIVPVDTVFEVQYTDGNDCAVSDANAKRVCKPGTTDCCIFLTMSPKGWMCSKFDGSSARHLLDRLHHKTINATRIGNCTCTGRVGFPTRKEVVDGS